MPPFYRRLFSHLPGAASFFLLSVAAAFPTSAQEAPPVEKTVTTGIWGTLEYYPIRLEPPTTQLWNTLFSERTVWNFGVLTETGALAELRGIGFREEILEALRSEGAWVRAKSGLEVTVPDSVLEGITPENRLALAEWLHANNYDFYNRIIVNIEGGDFSAFTPDKVSPDILELVRSRSFVRNGVLSFMDLPYVIRKIGDDKEARETFIRTIFSTRSLVVRLIIDETTDRASIVDYWSQGGRASRVESMVKGVQATMGVDKIDIVHLLPPLPRRYLYAFSRISDTGVHNTPDCFWASVHFFKRNPSPRVLDSLSLEHYLAHDFTEVPEEEGLRFGDIVCLLRPDNNSFLHSYVHIADDIVFTKNGASYVHPFILTLKSDMMSRYLHEGEFNTRVYRRIPGR
jgi:hypothetical protein